MPDVNTTIWYGKDVLLMKPNWVNNPKLNTSLLQGEFSTFGISRFYNNWNINKSTFGFGFLCETKEQCSDFRDFFDDHIGRLKSFWIPSWRSDIKVSSAFLASDSVINIEDYEYNDTYIDEDVVGRHLHFWFPDGTSVLRKVVASTGLTITIYPTIGKACSNVDRLVVSFLYMVRYNHDGVEWNYHNVNTAQIDVEFKQVFDSPGTTTTTTSSSTTSSTTTSSTSSTISTTSTTSTSTTTTTTTV